MRRGLGKVRVARLTDLAALGELSRLSHAPDGQADLPVRSLGLPVSANSMSVFSLFRMPLGALRAHDQLFLYEDERKVAGLVRVERDPQRDEWTIVELDAIDQGDAGDIRFRLVQHILRDGSRRGAARYHVACDDRDGNVELFMQAGFARYGEERIMFRGPDRPLPEPWSDEAAAAAGIRLAQPLDALELSRLYAAVTPQPVVRLEAYRLPDWERHSGSWPIPRSSLTPILRFADVETYVQERPGMDGLAALLQVGVAKEDQPHYLRLVVRHDEDSAPLIGYGLGVIAERNGRGRVPLLSGPSREFGVVSPVRTYESPTDRRLEEEGFAPIAAVSLLMRETLIRVAEPALMPVTTR